MAARRGVATFVWASTTVKNGLNDMTDRKNLKVAADTYDDLSEEKRDMETWDSFFRRLLQESR
jgi:hypothetical protein